MNWLSHYITAWCWLNLGLTLSTCFSAALAPAQSVMERLDHGLVAVPGDHGTFLSWRLLGTDQPDTEFNIYSVDAEGKTHKLNPRPINGPTWYLDEIEYDTPPMAYEVRPVTAGSEGEPTSSQWFREIDPQGNPFHRIPLQTPEGYTPNDASIGDLDGDGQYELVLQQCGVTKDNSQSGMTDPAIFQAYELDGTLLWEINLGINIRDGAHYTQFMVYDFDGDGKAEFVCKTADGTTDAEGNILGDAKADHRNEAGYILSGPEYLTIFDGLTGRALDTTNYIPSRHPDTENPSGDQLKAVWGDGYGNRCDRFNACVAYLDGKRPSMVFARGYYTRTVLAAFDFEDGKIKHRWTFDSADNKKNNRYAGQGNHQVSVADVDGDRRDEIVFGSMVIDDDGTGLYSTGWGHGDALHVSDMDPKRRGLEIFVPHESPSQYGHYGVAYFDARSGQPIWGVDGKGKDIGRGCAADIDPRYSGYEMWASSGIGGLYTAREGTRSADGPRGNEVSKNRPGAINFLCWWDGDPLRELLDGNHIDKWNWNEEKTERLLTAEGASSNNGTKSTPTLSGDLMGDWREEFILREDDGQALRLYTTTIPTDIRLFTLMHDRMYRLAIAWQNVGYNQPPHPSFYLGHDMDQPDWPDITVQASEKSVRR